MKNILILTTLFLFISIGFAHNGEDHSRPQKIEVSRTDSLAAQMDTASFVENEAKIELSHKDMSAYSTYHPLIVHFPIVLLIILPFFQLVALFQLKKEIGWAIIILAGFGFISAYMASNNFHPHTTGLTPQISKILKEHDYYAYLTVWMSLAAFVTKLISHFVLKHHKFSEFLVLVILLTSAYTVIMTGHHGAQLTHIYGVGPEGKFIEMNHSH
jgi:uncharacterized membrane protein